MIWFSWTDRLATVRWEEMLTVGWSGRVCLLPAEEELLALDPLWEALSFSRRWRLTSSCWLFSFPHLCWMWHLCVCLYSPTLHWGKETSGRGPETCCWALKMLTKSKPIMASKINDGWAGSPFPVLKGRGRQALLFFLVSWLSVLCFCHRASFPHTLNGLLIDVFPLCFLGLVVLSAVVVSKHDSFQQS